MIFIEKNITEENIALLNYAIDNGIINISDIQNIKNMKDKKKILELHPYTIWESEDGTNYTYVPDNTKKKGVAQRKRKSKAELEEVIIDYYTKNPNYLKQIQKPKKQEEIPKKRTLPVKDSFKNTFNDLVTFKRDIVGVSNNTIYKYLKDYERFFKDSSIENISIKKLDDEKIILYINQSIKTLQLTKRQGNDLINYMKMTFDRGIKKKIITESPFKYIDKAIFTKHFSQGNLQTSKNRTISEDEMTILNKRFEYYHEKKPKYIPIYAVELASLTGFRVGELSALRWDRINNGMIYIDSSEKYDQKLKQYYIEDTKNGKHRYFPITDEIQALLDKVYAIEKKYGYLSEFVFSNEKGRIHKGVICDCARNASIYIGMNSKSIHTYRRTVSSMMKCNGVATPIVASLMGHTEEVNDGFYTYDISGEKFKVDIVSKVNKEIKQK